MDTPTKKIFTISTACLLGMALVMSSCIDDLAIGEKSSGRRASKVSSNAPSSLSPGYGRIMEKNPVVLTGNENLAANASRSNFIRPDQTFLTTNSDLSESCNSVDGTGSVSSCYSVLNDPSASAIGKAGDNWGYHPDSDEFLQAHTFGHIKWGTEKYVNVLDMGYKLAWNGSTANYNTALPSTLFTSGAFWYDSELVAYSSCEDAANAFFRPSSFSLCFGVDPVNTGLVFSEDPSVIYHELGHALVKNMLNSRNRAAGLSTTVRADMGVSFYDEAGAINEGIADFMSYLVNQRTRMGEWALGRFYLADRPLIETESIHATGVSSESDERVRYPIFLNYEPRQPTLVVEDVHNAGMIASHYFVALVADFESYCSMTKTNAIYSVSNLIFETLAELGDLTAKGSDASPYGSVDNVNLTQQNSGGEYVAQTWTEKAYPMNFRRFFQTFAKHLLTIYNKNSNCNGATLSQTRIEQLLDYYGLLLFKSYNEDGNGTSSGQGTSNTLVSSANRVYSLLLPKDKLKLDPENGATQAFVFDQQSDMQNLVSALIASGQATDWSTMIGSGAQYNNGNGKISPGEIVGLSLNVYNDSNSTMGGVQILANDWDHVKLDTDGKFRPCTIDEFPTTSEGAASDDTSPSALVGDCGYTTRMNGTDQDSGTQKEYLKPICLAMKQDENETQWVMQSEYADFVGIETNFCLKGSDYSDECFIRTVPGADQANFSKIDPNSTWGETVINSGEIQFQTHNIVVFEINPYTPPGTTFVCRFRARFTNCDDCYIDSNTGTYYNDYYDYEYAGHKPFEVINFKFTVLD